MEIAYTGRGFAYSNLYNYKKAVADFTSAIQLSPDDATAYFNRSMVYSNNEDYELSLADLNKAVGLDPSYIDALLSRVIINKALHHLQDAINDCHTILKLTKDPVIIDQVKKLLAALGTY